MNNIRRTLPFAVVIALLVGAVICAVHPCRVQGTVVNGLSGEPITAAAVQIGQRSRYCNAAGQFDAGWVIGVVSITVQADGYLPAEIPLPSVAYPGQTLPMSLTLTPNTLVVHVQDAETGEALPDSSVALSGLTVTTDDRGACIFHCVKMGERLNASALGYADVSAVFAGQSTQNFALKPVTTQIAVFDLYTKHPLADAVVTSGSGHVRTDKDGVVTLKHLLLGDSLVIEALDHIATEVRYTGGGRVAVELRPNTLRGVVKNSNSGQAVRDATVSVVSASGVVTYAITGTDGGYAFLGLPYPITLAVAAAGYSRSVNAVSPVTEMNVALEPFVVKGIYMPLGILTDEAKVRELIDLVKRTELNAIVVDIKNDRGWLAYPSKLPEAEKSGAYTPQVMDVTKFVAMCHQEGIYAIARLVMFKDETLAAAYPAWAVHQPDDSVWKDASGAAWLDPFCREAQDYNIAIAREVTQLGFDELQFDYLRFPSDGALKLTRYAQESTPELRCQAIGEFCARLRQALQPYAVPMSADLFGMSAWVVDNDMGIGQRVKDIAPYMDYLSPMVYPATFSSTLIDYDEPVRYPYEVVYRSCVELAQHTSVRIRPWLQHYSWGDVTYGVAELRLQQNAAADADTAGWIFWNSAAVYNEEAFDPASRP